MEARVKSFTGSGSNVKGSKLSKLLYTIMFSEEVKGVIDLKWMRCFNDILVSVSHPDIFWK